MDYGDDRPLQPVVAGGGECQGDGDCNPVPTLSMPEDLATLRNHCDGASRRCLCNHAYTGPHCQTHHGFDDVSYDYADDVLPHPVVYSLYAPPEFLAWIALYAALFLGAILFIKRRKQQHNNTL